MVGLLQVHNMNASERTEGVEHFSVHVACILRLFTISPELTPK